MSGAALRFRDAVEADLPAIVAMLADDPLGAAREDPSLPLAPSYLAAFRAMARTPFQRVVVAEEAGAVVGTMQLILIPALSRRGGWRGQIEAVRVASHRRGRGHGAAFARWAVAEFRAAGCVAVQLTSDNSRGDAHRFWEGLGFAPTHLGFKLSL